jgi:hypothetical protein
MKIKVIVARINTIDKAKIVISIGLNEKMNLD